MAGSARWTGRTIARSGGIAAAVIAILVRLRHLTFVPLWDGRQYWDSCVAPALDARFDPLAFNCFGHRSMLYLLTVSWPAYVARDPILLIGLVHLALSLIAIAAF